LALSNRNRGRLFISGLSIAAGDVCFFLAWQHIRVSDVCKDRSLGIWLGFFLMMIALALSLFGWGWKRIALMVGCVVGMYFWFSWLMWMVQIC